MSRSRGPIRPNAVGKRIGRVAAGDEVPLPIKTTAARYPALEAVIRRRQPYELPEIVAVPLVRGLPAHLARVAAETALAPGASGPAPSRY
jgi:periplasmic divalent cation tolerance protein